MKSHMYETCVIIVSNHLLITDAYTKLFGKSSCAYLPITIILGAIFMHINSCHRSLQAYGSLT